MLQVPTKIMPSRIHGIGIFADQFIEKGTLIWKFQPGLDQIISQKTLQGFPSFTQLYLRRYAYLSSNGYYVLCFDDAKYFNHSSNPNVVGGHAPENGEDIDIAARDIFPGEELTTNYTEFDDEIYHKLGNEFPDYFRHGSQQRADCRDDIRPSEDAI